MQFLQIPVLRYRRRLWHCCVRQGNQEICKHIGGLSAHGSSSARGQPCDEFVGPRNGGVQLYKEASSCARPCATLFPINEYGALGPSSTRCCPRSLLAVSGGRQGGLTTGSNPPLQKLRSHQGLATTAASSCPKRRASLLSEVPKSSSKDALVVLTSTRISSLRGFLSSGLSTWHDSSALLVRT